MKFTIVKSSDLNDCWSPLRFNHSCHECDKVLTCKHEQAAAGREIVLGQKLKVAKLKVSEIQKKIEANRKTKP